MMINLQPGSVLRPGQKWFITSCSRRLFSQEVVRENDIVLLKARNDSKLAPVLTPPLKAGETINFKDLRWKLRADDVIGKPFRDTVTAPKRVSYRIYKPTLADYVVLSPRKVTPIYPKEANVIVSLLDLHPSVPNEANKSQNEARMEIFEAGTGHGALTLHLARAIHGANTAAPPIPELKPGDEVGDKEEVYNQWRANRRAVIHTLDSSRQHSDHARMTVKNFRNGLYYPHVDFHVGNINEYLSKRLSEVGDVFLDHGILDLPDTQDEMEIVGNCMKPSGSLITFCPSVTQIIRCLRTVKDKNLRFTLESVVELGYGMSGGREWDIRLVKPRALLKAAAEARRLSVVKEGAVSYSDPRIGAETPESGHEAEATNDVSEISETDNTDSESPPLDPKNTEDSSGWEMICKPMVGTRITVGAFVGVWRKI